MITPSTPGRRRRPGKGLAVVLAAGLLLAACGGGGAGDGGGGRTPVPPTAPSIKSFEDAKNATIETWGACEMFADHVRELAEFLDYKKFADDLSSGNGSSTAGVRICEGRAILHEDPKSRFDNAEARIEIGFGRANMERDIYHEEKYKTPTGRYDLKLQLMRDVYDNPAGNPAERTVDGPWDKATILLGDTSTGTTLSAFIVDTERDFMLELSLGDVHMDRHGDKLTWNWEKAAKHFREVTMVNSYQAMADRFDEAK